MKIRPNPQIDPRGEDDFLRRLLELAPAFVPGWEPAQDDPGAALLHVHARYLEILARRLNDAPSKNRLAFLDLLGIDLIPAQAARAPLVFKPIPGLGDGRIPAGTRAGAKVVGLSEPLAFETLSATALVQAQLAEVVSLWPERDAWANHSRAAIGNQPFTLFDGMQPTPHELYLAHDVHFALAGQSSVEIEFHLSTPSSQALDLGWEYWDGEDWRAFEPFADTRSPGKSFDDTGGLTHSGVMRLVTGCAAAARHKVQGIESYWLRARLAAPYPPAAGVEPPRVERLVIRTVIDRRLPEEIKNRPETVCQPGILPDPAFADAQKLDLTKDFQPLGSHPLPGSVFYIACDEAFGKPGAQITACFRRKKTAQEEADDLAREYEQDLRDADEILQRIKDKNDAMILILEALVDASGHLGKAIGALFPAGEPEAWHADVVDHMKKARDAAAGALTRMVAIPAFGLLGGVFSVGDLAMAAAETIIQLSDPGAPGSAMSDLITAARNFRDSNLTNFIPRWGELITAISKMSPTAWGVYQQNLPSFIADARTAYAGLSIRLTTAKTRVDEALALAREVSDMLGNFSSIQGAAVRGDLPPVLPLPQIAWEYWNGSGWQSLQLEDPSSSNQGPPGVVDIQNLRTSGSLSFDAPPDWEKCTVNRQTAHWLRLRQAGGSFALLRLVTWTDQMSNTNLVPIVEPRPPTLEAFHIGYFYASPAEPPTWCLSFNDFQWQDHSEEQGLQDGGFAPFHPLKDTTPAVYLGFNRPLPADQVSLYFDLAETVEEPENPPLQWEYFDRGGWSALAVEDATHNLARPEVASVQYPGVTPEPQYTVLQGRGGRVSLAETRQAAGFLAGDRVYLERGENNEVASVAGVEGNQLLLKIPLEGDFSGGRLSHAGLARFGTPRTWIRLRLPARSTPPHLKVGGIYPNAAWAAAVQTIRDEPLGSSTAGARQVFFFRNHPVLAGQVVEVRELEGARAAVELPLLLRELEAHGLQKSDLRSVTDPVTGKVRQAWVRWQERPHLLFSGAEDRHYMVERSNGRLIFGDGVHGKAPPAGVDNILARQYRSGGGRTGNLPAGEIKTLLSGVPAQTVSNTRAAQGGAEGESFERAGRRAPQVLRHRRQAVTLADWEALALEASPAVAVARAHSGVDPAGRATPGWVQLVIIPQGDEAQPQPSPELRRQVLEFLQARSPAGLGGRIRVSGPDYLEVGIDARVAALQAAAGGPLLERLREALLRFLHPLSGGPEGQGWPFGRDVYISDAAAVMEGVDGVDYLSHLIFTLQGSPQGDFIAVPAERVVAAGALRLALAGKEG